MLSFSISILASFDKQAVVDSNILQEKNYTYIVDIVHYLISGRLTSAWWPLTTDVTISGSGIV